MKATHCNRSCVGIRSRQGEFWTLLCLDRLCPVPRQCHPTRELSRKLAAGLTIGKCGQLKRFEQRTARKERCSCRPTFWENRCAHTSARFELRITDAGEQARLHPGGGFIAGPGNRIEHRDLHAGELDPSAISALSRSGPAGDALQHSAGPSRSVEWRIGAGLLRLEAAGAVV